ncbi:PAS domain S-box protein [Methanospirillum stamsii]|uniref:Histidine kinase n=1 Tax=Methanospirillum stamsii TaxID=1277351 RepID=A0A2V2NG68_9EURY|nr:PAS domain S-box protein [Methanospirillum stamsii]PWR74601.1 hypothetical protein DLD82_08445 [Methanospirillum stamsii]
MQDSDSNQPIRVLFVDDEPSMSDIAHYFLGEKLGGCTVVPAMEVSIALELLEKEDFDVIVADYEMPDLDGLAFLKILRERGDTIPFLVCTGKSRHEVVIEALNAGADFYLQKGEDPIVLFTEMKQMIFQAVSRRRSEQALASSRHLLEEMIDFLPDATMAVNNSHYVIAWNRIMEKLTGISSEQIIGKNPDISSVFFKNRIIAELIEFILKNGERTEFSHYNSTVEDRIIIEEFHSRTDHNEENDSYFRVMVSPILDTSMKKVGFIGSFRNITLEKRYELELVESRENFRALVENNTDIVMRFDIHGRHLYVNPAVSPYIPFDSRLLIGKTYSELLYPPRDCRKWDSLIQKVITTASPVETDITFFSPKGKIILNWRLFPEFDQKGQVRSVLSISRDITYHEMLEQEKQALLSQIERNLGEFAILNDGIRNPLAVITGWLSMMESLQDHERKTLMLQVRQIDEMITKLDRRWIESEKVLGFLRRHYSIQSHPYPNRK